MIISLSQSLVHLSVIIVVLIFIVNVSNGNEVVVLRYHREPMLKTQSLTDGDRLHIEPSKAGTFSNCLFQLNITVMLSKTMFQPTKNSKYPCTENPNDPSDSDTSGCPSITIDFGSNYNFNGHGSVASLLAFDGDQNVSKFQNHCSFSDTSAVTCWDLSGHSIQPLTNIKFKVGEFCSVSAGQSMDFTVTVKTFADSNDSTVAEIVFPVQEFKTKEEDTHFKCLNKSACSVCAAECFSCTSDGGMFCDSGSYVCGPTSGYMIMGCAYTQRRVKQPSECPEFCGVSNDDEMNY